ncbi:Crp/Fnr family transcriptional regulator [Mucilaginibacter sp. PAMB04274]|uniref:Crp/Fnr family transcriptional regulator n=1 Tax=Mucilaginibacter sp. PAMB04274 TaxID=3138568 RepID=UPI0031F5F19F
MFKENLSVSDYINQHFSQFEPPLKDFLKEHASVMDFPAGEVIMRTGQYIRATVMIVEGRVKLYREGEDGGEFFMYYLEPGNACALSMICATKQETSQIMAKAVEDTRVLMVPIGLMDDMMKQFKTWYYFVLETYRFRYEELLVVIDHIAFKNMDERLAHYLANQHEKLHTRELKITHQEIATDLHSSREVISRLLKKMEQRKDLILHRNYIEWLR